MSAATVALGDVAEFIRGITYKPSDLVDNFSDGSVVCMRTANVQATLDDSNLLSIPDSFVRSDTKLLREGDLLVSTANSWNLVGKCCWVPALPYPASVGGFIAALRADKAKIDPRYLYRWFSSPETQALARNCGRQTTNISNMDLGRCLALQLPLPPLAEQRRIAAILDKADALRAKRRDSLGLVQALAVAYFEQEFGSGASPGATSRLADVTLLITKGTTPTTLGWEFVDSGIPFLRVQNLLSSTVNLDDVLFISPETHEALERSKVRPNDVLISIAGTIGRTALVPEQMSEMNCNQAVAIIRCAEKLEPIFLLYWLQSKRAQDQIRTGQVTGTISNISLGLLRALALDLPAIERQREFAAKVRKMGAAIEVHEAAVRKVELLFSALQSQAFMGRL